MLRFKKLVNAKTCSHSDFRYFSFHLVDIRMGNCRNKRLDMHRERRHKRMVDFPADNFDFLYDNICDISLPINMLMLLDLFLRK